MCNVIEHGNMSEQGGRGQSGRLGKNVQKTDRPRWQGALFVVCTAITLCTSTASYADDVAAMVREADRYRLQSNAAKETGMEAGGGREGSLERWEPSKKALER